MHGDFWAKVKSKIFHVKLLIVQLLENFGVLFNSASGHSGSSRVQMLTLET